MNLHEFQSKLLFTEYGIPVPEGRVVQNSNDAVAAVEALGGRKWVVKAQVHAGGRGKAGGVKLVDSAEQVAKAVEAMIGMRLRTHQSGTADGLPVERVLIECAQPIDRELYLSLLTDRSAEQAVFIGSAAGGMDIEQVAAEAPERIVTVAVPAGAGFQPYQARRLGFAMGLDKEQIKALTRLCRALYDLYLRCDASLVEINPLIVTESGELVALDAKINLDDNALYRQQRLAEWRDASQEDPREYEAAEHGLSYVSLDGDIGCMVNGAGLAMATMDAIKLHGGNPANFLDVGGAATAERVTHAFKLILADEKVKAILVNIFGGIVRCDVIAEGIIEAAAQVNLSVPLVVRLEGTNVEQGRTLLADSGLSVITADDLADAAAKVVAAAG